MTKLTEVSGLQKYNFDIHKGYGTKAHREAIMEYGLSKEHRVSFCKNLKK
jgi:ribonuclease HII